MKGVDESMSFNCCLIIWLLFLIVSMFGLVIFNFSMGIMIISWFVLLGILISCGNVIDMLVLVNFCLLWIVFVIMVGWVLVLFGNVL